MSSQGSKTVVGIDNSIFSGDASNWISMKKRKVIYTTLKNNVSKVSFNQAQSSNLRLDYNFGFVGCSGCTGAFPELRLGV